MIIDCHGHYTTAPRELELYRNAQLAGSDDNFSALQRTLLLQFRLLPE